MLFTAIQKTPLGSLQLVAHEHVLLAAGFGSLRELVARLEKSDYDLGFKSVKKIPIISDLMEDYFAGDFAALNGIKVRQPGAEFSQAVWKAMRRIPAGKTMSYAELAAKAGSANAVRAAGSACARNLIAPIVPCHRVVKTGGELGNYAYGLNLKEELLRLESALN
jgi:methylated-DNA-[protein]-cysteine S-methyltransferase